MTSRRNFLGLITALPLAGLMARPARASSPETFAFHGVAINGYDPIAYFTDSMPVEGNVDVTHHWKGATWQFASAANRDTFIADPEAWAPQYGGYCAYALSRGAIATTEPDAWTVYEGRLYLNYNTRVRDIWQFDKPGNIALADANWPAVLDL